MNNFKPPQNIIHFLGLTTGKEESFDADTILTLQDYLKELHKQAKREQEEKRYVPL